MKMRIYRTGVIVGVILLVAIATTSAQTENRKVIKTEVKVVDNNAVVTVTSSGDPQAHVSTFAFVASEMGFESKIVKGAPFSADTVNEFTQILGNGQRIYRNNTGALYRDGEGRTRREQTIDAIGPYASSGPVHKSIVINDPVAGVCYVLNPEDHSATKTSINVMSGGTGGMMTAYVVKAGDPALAHVSEPQLVVEGVKTAGGYGVMGGTVAKVVSHTNSRTEPLGTQIIEGVTAEGWRTTETIPAGAIGNETPIEIVSEKWYSEELGVVVKTSRNDPMSGQTVYQLKNIRRGEPSPDFYQLPADYTVKEAVVKVQTIKK
jgi:hypothetical protein